MATLPEQISRAALSQVVRISTLKIGKEYPILVAKRSETLWVDRIINN